MYSCDVCGGQFQIGPHVYDGRYIQAYRIKACNGCCRGNWDGWAPQFEAAVTANLVREGLPLPKRNAKGWLPLDG